MFVNPLFLSCFDGEDDAAAAAADAAAKAAEDAKGALTQEQFQKALADERRKSEARYKAVLAEKAQALQDLIDTKALTEQQKKDAEEQLNEVNGKLLSEKQQLEKRIKDTESQLNTKLKIQEQAAKDWESKFTQTEIQRELQSAAVQGDAFNPSQMIALLKPMTKMVTVDGVSRVVVEQEETVNGQTVTVQRSPEEAIKAMKALPAQFGNLFKSSVVSGVGGNNAAGSPQATGAVDWKHLTQAQYEELRGKHPDLPSGRGRKK